MTSFGFSFWLLWILGFVGSFLAAAGFWTWVLAGLFGNLSEPEIVTTWCVAVFGCWFLILTPFMRKKEQIWKRLNNDEEKAVSAWLLAMGLFIASLILSGLFWGWQRKSAILSNPGFDGQWVKRVLGTWLLLILPLLAFLYKKADQIYKAALARQTHLGPKFQTTFVEKEKRLLPESVVKKIQSFPAPLKDGHVVNLILKDGRIIPDVFIFRETEILGLYNAREFSFDASEIVDLEPVAALAPYEEAKWLRLDGRA